MNLIFKILSVIYIAGVFLFADSPVVSTVAPFNPYSLLHIPLYGILTGLLTFSIVPCRFNRMNALPHLRINAPTHLHFLIPGIIALIVAIADEIHQFFIPTRDASIIDAILDAIGIVLALFLISQLHKKRKAQNSLCRI